MFFRYLSVILLFLLASCSVPEQVVSAVKYHQPGTPGGRLCTSQCKKASNYCNEACNYKERMCAYDVQSQAIKDYEIYVQDQFKNRNPVDLRPRDFEHMDQCVQTACSVICERNYNRCFKKCGGEITYSQK